MILEIAQFDIKNGMEQQFEEKVAQAMPLFRRAKGCRSMELHRSSEVPRRYRLFVEWETLENHTIDFRQSDDFKEWRRLVGDCFESPPYVEHTSRIGSGFRRDDF